MYRLAILAALGAAACLCAAIRYRFLAAAHTVPEIPMGQALGSMLAENPDWYTAVGQRYLSRFHTSALAMIGCGVLSVALRALAAHRG